MEPALPIFADRLTGKKNGSFRLLDVAVSPGEHASLGLPLPEILEYAPLYMPIKVLNGRTEGPVLLMFATMRGDEFNGLEIIKRVTSLAAMDRLHGTIIAAPVLNVVGLLSRSRFAPGERLLETAFPGSPEGDYAERLAHLFVQTLFDQCDICLQLGCGPMNHRTLPHVYADFDVPGNRELATHFPVSVVVNAESSPNTLQAIAREQGKPMLTYRAGEAMRFSKSAIRLGSRGIPHLLRAVGMLPSEGHEGPEEAPGPVVCQASEWVFAPKSGISHFEKKLGDRVAKGDLLARINDPLAGLKELKIPSPHDGLIVGLNEMPLVSEGDWLMRIATFQELDAAADALQSWSIPAAVEPEEPEAQALS